MDDRKWERWSALGGILFVVLVVITIILPGEPPMTSDPTSDMVKFVRDNGDEIRYATYTGALAAVFFFWWLGAVWRLMRRHEGGTPRLAVVALSGAVFGAVMATVGGIVVGIMPIVGTPSLGPGGTRAFYILGTNIGFASLFGSAVFVGAVSALIIRTEMMPAILGWFGALVALVDLVGAAAVSSTRDAVFVFAFIGFLGFILWALIASILMLRVTPEAAPAPM